MVATVQTSIRTIEALDYRSWSSPYQYMVDGLVGTSSTRMTCPPVVTITNTTGWATDGRTAKNDQAEACNIQPEKVKDSKTTNTQVTKSQPSAHVARKSEWCANMVCYIWFSKTSALPKQENHASMKRKRTDSFAAPVRTHKASASVALPMSATTSFHSIPQKNQLFPTEQFQAFVQRVLKTTQVSQSVINLALYYISQLKTRHNNLQGQSGSEYRLFLTSLILANKFLDDYTYTNKTWSDVSRTSLKEITKMEMQLLSGLGTTAYISPTAYADWCNMLKKLQRQRDIDVQWLSWREEVTKDCSSSPVAMVSPLNKSPLSNMPLPNPTYTPPQPVSVLPAPDEAASKRKRSWHTMESESQQPVRFMSSPIETTTPNVAYASNMLRSLSPVSLEQMQPAWQPTVWNGLCSLPNMVLDDSSNVNAAFNKPACDMELLWPSHPQLTPMIPDSSFHLTSPLVLEYYRLAAGYPYGIPAMTSVEQAGTMPFIVSNPVYPDGHVNGSFALPEQPLHSLSSLPDGAPSSSQSPWTMPMVHQFPSHDVMTTNSLPQQWHTYQ
ncbi:cyclin-dependent protein serine/threonine kinase regulator [Malassezia pachydermatis]